MSIAFGTLLVLIGCAIGGLLVRAFSIGRSAGQYVQEVQELNKALSIANGKHDQLSNDFYKLRLKLASRLHWNGD